MADSTQTRRARKDALADLRALLGRVRSKGFKVDDRKRAFTYRSGLQAVLLSARVSHVKTSPSEFFAALDALTRLDSQRFARQPVGHDFLLQLLDAAPLPIEQEVRWIAARLRYEQKVISEHLRSAARIESTFLAGNFADCLTKLQSHEEALGSSLWSTELKFALTQSSQGLEAQKATLREIKAVRRKGIWPFVANAASVRAEPSVSISWFLEETRRRQERLKSSQFTDYLKYRGTGRWPDTNAGCARVLRVEQNHHVIDVYETLISYFQETSTRACAEEHRSALHDALLQLREIDDVRLRKLEFAITGTVHSSVELHALDLTDLLFADASHAPLAAALRRQFRLPSSPERMVALALGTDRVQLANSETSSQAMIGIRGLTQALRRVGYQSSTAGRADERLKKLAYVYSPLPFGKSLLSLLDAATSPRTGRAMKRLQIAALNSNVWGVLDLIGFASHTSYPMLRRLFRAGSTTEFSDMVAHGSKHTPQASLRQDATSLAQALNELASAKFTSAVRSVVPALDSSNRLVAAQAAVVALNAFVHTGDVEAAAELISQEHVENGVDPDSMPVREIYQDLDWRDMREAAALPQLSIALSLIQSSEGDDRLRTYRRFALETLLQSVEKAKPSELRSVKTGWPSAYLIYFLENVCTAAMLDMLPSIKSSREVLEERREISGFLATVDKSRVEQHQQEVLEISRELTVLDGLRTIDGSRVHVDTESLARRLKVDLAESFQRYASLSKGSESTLDGVSALLKDFSKEQPPDYLLSMPVSEADELLVSMFLRSRERFLFDVPHGLDSYISKRIRHGSIVGVVRAPAEREGVVAKRNLDGTYRSGGTWADSLGDLQQRAALAAAIASTSKAIDQHLIRLKDVILHVKSDARPHGLFEAPLSPPAYLVIRSFASTDASLDSFIDTMFKSLWGMLGPSLSHAQDILRRDSVAFVSDQFQSLRAKAQRIISNPDERAAFDAVAVRASVGMQTALLAAASWFEPAKSTPRSYSLEEAVAIAVESVRATTTGFAPDLHVSTNYEFSFSELALPLVCDVLYIALGNVAAHANVLGNPSVWLEVNRDEGGKHIVFSVKNEVRFTSDGELEKLQRKIGEVRRELAASNGASKARLEGGSGLHKLAAIVSQVEGDELRFECTSARFELLVKLSFSPERPF